MYYGQVTAVDEEVGRVVQGLDALDLVNDTIVVYVSDHGDHLGSHVEYGVSLRGKASPYATTFRIPLIVRWSGQIAEDEVCDALVSSVGPGWLGGPGCDAGVEQGGLVSGKRRATKCGRAYGLGVGSHSNAWRAVWDGR